MDSVIRPSPVPSAVTASCPERSPLRTSVVGVSFVAGSDAGAFSFASGATPLDTGATRRPLAFGGAASRGAVRAASRSVATPKPVRPAVTNFDFWI